MKTSSILTTAALVVGMAVAPTTVVALDLGGSVDKASKSVSSATRSASRSVGSTTTSIGSAVNSLGGGGSGGTGDGGTSGGTSGVLNNYQLISLGLGSNPPDQAGNKVTPTYVRALVSGLDRFERQRLEVRCDSVLRSPKAYDSELIQLCQILASI